MLLSEGITHRARLSLVLLVRSAVGRAHSGLSWMPARVQALWALASLLAGWAPYLAVFSYQRHLIPLLIMAGTLFCSLFLVTPRLAADVSFSAGQRGLVRRAVRS